MESSKKLNSKKTTMSLAEATTQTLETKEKMLPRAKRFKLFVFPIKKAFQNQNMESSIRTIWTPEIDYFLILSNLY